MNHHVKSGILAVWLISAAPAMAGIYDDELTQQQRNQVQAGQTVLVTREVQGKPWPEATVYLRIDSTPEEAAAVFFDYDRHKDYIPKLKRSQRVRQIDPRTFDVAYTLQIPFFSDENYTVRDTLSAYDNGHAYRVEWTLIEADSTKETRGNVRFEALGTGTIMAYYNFVVPGRGFAGWVRNSAIRQVQETAEALGKQVVLERTRSRGLLESQLQRLREALSLN